MSKPTPGPEYLTDWVRRYLGEDAIEDDAVDITVDGIVKMIWRLNVEGRAAVDTLEKIQAVMKERLLTDEDVIEKIMRLLAPTTGGKAST